MKKIGIISQARMTSTRLPGKVFMTVNDIPLLKYHSDRVRQSGYPFFIATTVNATDDPIVAFAEKEGIPYFRGDEMNVLSRYYGCAKEHNLDIVVRVTSDCPLIDGFLIKKILDEELYDFTEKTYLSNGLEKSYPLGLSFEVVSFPYLEEAYQNATLALDLEHVTPYINRNRSGETVYKHFKHYEDKSKYRITVDTPDDFTLIKVLIEDFQADKLSYQEIIEVMDANPELEKINAHIEQKKE